MSLRRSSSDSSRGEIDEMSNKLEEMEDELEEIRRRHRYNNSEDPFHWSKRPGEYINRAYSQPRRHHEDYARPERSRRHDSYTESWTPPASPMRGQRRRHHRDAEDRYLRPRSGRGAWLSYDVSLSFPLTDGLLSPDDTMSDGDRRASLESLAESSLSLDRHYFVAAAHHSTTQETRIDMALSSEPKEWTEVHWYHLRRSSLDLGNLDTLVKSVAEIGRNERIIASRLIKSLRAEFEDSSSELAIPRGYVLRYGDARDDERTESDTTVTFISAPFFRQMKTSDSGEWKDTSAVGLLQSEYPEDDVQARDNDQMYAKYCTEKPYTRLCVSDLWVLMFEKALLTFSELAINDHMLDLFRGRNADSSHFRIAKIVGPSSFVFYLSLDPAPSFYELRGQIHQQYSMLENFKALNYWLAFSDGKKITEVSWIESLTAEMPTVTKILIKLKPDRLPPRSYFHEDRVVPPTSFRDRSLVIDDDLLDMERLSIRDHYTQEFNARNKKEKHLKAIHGRHQIIRQKDLPMLVRNHESLSNGNKLRDFYKFKPEIYHFPREAFERPVISKPKLLTEGPGSSFKDREDILTDDIASDKESIVGDENSQRQILQMPQHVGHFSAGRRVESAPFGSTGMNSDAQIESEGQFDWEADDLSIVPARFDHENNQSESQILTITSLDTAKDESTNEQDQSKASRNEAAPETTSTSSQEHPNLERDLVSRPASTSAPDITELDLSNNALGTTGDTFVAKSPPSHSDPALVANERASEANYESMLPTKPPSPPPPRLSKDIFIGDRATSFARDKTGPRSQTEDATRFMKTPHVPACFTWGSENEVQSFEIILGDIYLNLSLSAKRKQFLRSPGSSLKNLEEKFPCLKREGNYKRRLGGTFLQHCNETQMQISEKVKDLSAPGAGQELELFIGGIYDEVTETVARFVSPIDFRHNLLDKVWGTLDYSYGVLMNALSDPFESAGWSLRSVHECDAIAKKLGISPPAPDSKCHSATYGNAEQMIARLKDEDYREEAISRRALEKFIVRHSHAHFLEVFCFLASTFFDFVINFRSAVEKIACGLASTSVPLSSDLRLLPISFVQSFEFYVLAFFQTSKVVASFDRHYQKYANIESRNNEKSLRSIEDHKDQAVNALERAMESIKNAGLDVVLGAPEKAGKEVVQIRTVGVPFVATSLLINVQQTVFGQDTDVDAKYGSGFRKLDTNVAVTYERGFRKLQCRASLSPRKKLLHDIHHFTEELDAVLKKLSSFRWVLLDLLAVLDPRSFHITTETRKTQYRLECEHSEGQRRVLLTNMKKCQELRSRASELADQVKRSVEILEEGHGKAIITFTTITTVFLPLSFVASVFGMNTSDVRNMNSQQWVFWASAIPFTVLITAVTILIAFKGSDLYEQGLSIRAWWTQQRLRLVKQENRGEAVSFPLLERYRIHGGARRPIRTDTLGTLDSHEGFQYRNQPPALN